MVVCFRGCSGCFWWSGCGNGVGALREEEEVAAEAAAGEEVDSFVWCVSGSKVPVLCTTCTEVADRWCAWYWWLVEC